MYSIFNIMRICPETLILLSCENCYLLSVQCLCLCFGFPALLFGLWSIAVSHYPKLSSVISHLHNLPRIITASLLRFKFIQKSLLDGTLSSIFLRSSWQHKSGDSTKTERTKINFPKLQDVLDEMGLR